MFFVKKVPKVTSKKKKVRFDIFFFIQLLSTKLKITDWTLNLQLPIRFGTYLIMKVTGFYW